MTDWISVKDRLVDRGTGKELLVCNMNQGEVMTLVRWNTIHGRWESKGVPILSLQATHWTVPEPPETEQEADHDRERNRYDQQR